MENNQSQDEGRTKRGIPLMTSLMIRLVITGCLSGCVLFEPLSDATPYPTEYLPTVIALTVEADSQTLEAGSPSATPSAQPATFTPTASPRSSLSDAPNLTLTPTYPSPTVTPTARRPTRTSTIIPTPSLPIAAIQILRPGPQSKVISPLEVSAILEPGAKGLIQLELLGEDGRVLVRKLLSFGTVNRAHVLVDLEYEIPGVAEAGRVQISTQDTYGRTVALASVNVLLLSLGTEDINPPGELLESIVIREPAPFTLIQGGKVVVVGMAQLSGKDPLIVEMFDAQGKTIGATRLVMPAESPDGTHSIFTVEASYTVSAPTWVLLCVSERGGRIPGITHLSSVLILLSP